MGGIFSLKKHLFLKISSALKVSVVWCGGGVGQPITLSIPTGVEVELGCDKSKINP
jgi:hypothetical protein